MSSSVGMIIPYRKINMFQSTNQSFRDLGMGHISTDYTQQFLFSAQVERSCKIYIDPSPLPGQPRNVVIERYDDVAYPMPDIN